MNSTLTATVSGEQPAHWGGVLAMTLCIFALVASEFMPVSLLTPMAADLHVTEGMVGQGIAISGAFAVLTSLSIAALAGNMNRKTLLLGLALIPLGTWIAPVTVLLGLWGLIATAAPVAWWSWVTQTMPNNAEAGGGLMVAVVQLAIALGSTVGGLLFDYRGYESTFVASAVVLLISAVLAVLTSKLKS